MKTYVLLSAAALFALGCSSALGPDIDADGLGVSAHTATRSIITFYGTYPYTDRGLDTGDYTTMPPTFATGIGHGLLVELQVLHELSPNWALGISGGLYRVDTKDPFSPPLEGAPVMFRAQYGRYSRTGTIRYYFTIANGYMLYGGVDDVSDLDNEWINFSSIGMEILGRQNLDLRFEWGNLLVWESRYHQWVAGLGLAYNF